MVSVHDFVCLFVFTGHQATFGNQTLNVITQSSENLLDAWDVNLT